MNELKVLVQMLRQLLKDMEIVTSQGSGYYTCTPFAQRYNKLMRQSRTLFPDAAGLMGTFAEIDENDPKDPSDKLKVLLGVRIEVSQLITLLEAAQQA